MPWRRWADAEYGDPRPPWQQTAIAVLTFVVAAVGAVIALLRLF